MARKRMIDPDLWSDEKVQELPWAAVPFYIGLINFADDHGRLTWSARQLHMRIVGVRDDVTARQVADWMARIVALGLITVYEVDGKQYAVFESWRKHQYVNKAQESRIPPPPLPEQHVTLTLPFSKNGDAEGGVPPPLRNRRGLSKDKEEKISKEKELVSATGDFAPPPKPRAVRHPCECAVAEVPDIAGPEEAVASFLAVFTNRRTDDSRRSLLSPWTGTLREMRAKGYTWQGVWDAFALAHADGSHAPLHGLSGVWSNLRAASANGRASPSGGGSPSLRVPPGGWPEGSDDLPVLRNLEAAVTA